jgi:hypothetical protein
MAPLASRDCQILALQAAHGFITTTVVLEAWGTYCHGQGASLSRRLWQLWTCARDKQGGMQVEAVMAPPLSRGTSASGVVHPWFTKSAEDPGGLGQVCTAGGGRQQRAAAAATAPYEPVFWERGTARHHANLFPTAAGSRPVGQAGPASQPAWLGRAAGEAMSKGTIGVFFCASTQTPKQYHINLFCSLSLQ